MSPYPRRLAPAILLLCMGNAAAADPAALSSCAATPDDVSRLACYDRLSGRSPVVQPALSQQPSPPSAAGPSLASELSAAGPSLASELSSAQVAPLPPAPAGAPEPVFSGSHLSRHWELDDADKQGTFRFRPHRPNYLVVNLNSSPNSAPFGPGNPLSAASPAGIDHAELMFQLGFKAKLVERAGGSPADLWFGYTQQSHWQAFNPDASRPFRETNYQPELMAVLPLNAGIGGLRARFLNLGLVHQSNGQSGLRSRSWNRLYAQLGAEYGALSLTVRAWKRLAEGDDDDNPDISDYMGRGDITAAWRHEGHEVTLIARRNFSTRHGMVELGWAFPLATGLKGYVQVFSGYGQSLIDYNYAQKALGLGIMIAL